jgi:hypothetical protein
MDREESQEPARPERVGPEYWKQPKRSKLVYLVSLIVAVVILAAGYWFLLRSKPTHTAPAAQSQSGSSATVAENTDHYDSSNLFLGVDYPHGWTVTDTAGSGKLSISSPAIQLKDANGQTITGQIFLSIRDKTQKLTEFDKGAAVAVRDSEKIAYTKPSQNQRGSTFISFLQYATSAGGGSLDGIYITGDNGYQKGQNIPLADISKSDPVINIGFLKCADSKCKAGSTPLSLKQTVWDDNSFSKPLKNMLQSLSIT